MTQQEETNHETTQNATVGAARQEATHQKNKPRFTQVDNAHASGLGAMGRNDEKLPTGAEAVEPQPDDPAY